MLKKKYKALGLAEKSDKVTEDNGDNLFVKLKLKETERQDLVDEFIKILPHHYIDALSYKQIFEDLEKPIAAQKVINEFPLTKIIRSADIGEILAVVYINEEMPYCVPINKLQWKSRRDTPMHGEDAIGFLIDKESKMIKILKVEAKSEKALRTKTLEDARVALDKDDGFFEHGAIGYIADKLRLMGKRNLANLIDNFEIEAMGKDNSSQTAHLIFVFTSSPVENIQKTAFYGYDGKVQQYSVGLQIEEHQEFIESVYEGAVKWFQQLKI